VDCTNVHSFRIHTDFKKKLSHRLYSDNERKIMSNIIIGYSKDTVQHNVVGEMFTKIISSTNHSYNKILDYLADKTILYLDGARKEKYELKR